MTYSIAWLRKPPNGCRRVFYFMKSDHVIDNLSKCRMKISDFEGCNDIFELASIDLRETANRETHRCWLAKVKDQVGLICFSDNWQDPLMWGHYAKNGSGCCLVLDVDVSFLQKVEYVQRRKVWADNVPLPIVTDSSFHSFCATKSAQWRYEEEYRYFVSLKTDSGVISEGGRFFQTWGERIRFVGVINGPRPNLSEGEIMKNASAQNFFQSRAAFREFRIVSQQNKSRWKRDKS